VKTKTSEPVKVKTGELLTLRSKEEAEYFDCLTLCQDLMFGVYWFRLSRLSMVVIGSFAYTKTKSVESAV
jgi:hypothetical protein